MNKSFFKIISCVSISLCAIIIIALLAALKAAEYRLEKISQIVDDIAIQHIITEVAVNDTIPLNSDINVTEEIEVNIDLNLKTTIPLQVEIPVDQSLLVPFELGVLDFITIDTLIEVTKNVNIIVDDTIPLDQKVNVSVFGGKGFGMPIRGNIPVDQKLNIGFDELLPVKSIVPVDLLIIDTLPVGLSLRIPVDLDVPVQIPIKTKAKISFNGPLPVDASVPIELAIPVDIPLEHTSLSSYFKKLGISLRNLPKLQEDSE